MLNVQPDVLKKIWVLESARVTSGADLASKADGRRPTLKLRMRSLYNVLNFFAYGVQVPPEDEQEGRATDLSSFRAAVASGEAVDIATLIQIRYSERAPERAYQAVRYGGLWFYIDDGDLSAVRPLATVDQSARRAEHAGDDDPGQLSHRGAGAGRTRFQWTAAGDSARFMLIVHHTDAEREWAYDR